MRNCIERMYAPPACPRSLTTALFSVARMIKQTKKKPSKSELRKSASASGEGSSSLFGRRGSNDMPTSPSSPSIASSSVASNTTAGKMEEAQAELAGCENSLRREEAAVEDVRRRVLRDITEDRLRAMAAMGKSVEAAAQRALVELHTYLSEGGGSTSSLLHPSLDHSFLTDSRRFSFQRPTTGSATFPDYQRTGGTPPPSIPTRPRSRLHSQPRRSPVQSTTTRRTTTAPRHLRPGTTLIARPSSAARPSAAEDSPRSSRAVPATKSRPGTCKSSRTLALVLVLLQWPLPLTATTARRPATSGPASGPCLPQAMRQCSDGSQARIWGSSLLRHRQRIGTSAARRPTATTTTMGARPTRLRTLERSEELQGQRARRRRRALTSVSPTLRPAADHLVAIKVSLEGRASLRSVGATRVRSGRRRASLDQSSHSSLERPQCRRAAGRAVRTR